MKTKVQVLKDNAQYKTLINAVINRVGLDSVEDIMHHGISGGYGGFIYYEDTHKFAMRYRKDIISMLEETADSIGEDVVAMVCRFNCVNADKDDKRDLYSYLGMSKVEQGSITNALAWFAAEEVCRMFEE